MEVKELRQYHSLSQNRPAKECQYSIGAPSRDDHHLHHQQQLQQQQQQQLQQQQQQRAVQQQQQQSSCGEECLGHPGARARHPYPPAGDSLYEAEAAGLAGYGLASRDPNKYARQGVEYCLREIGVCEPIPQRTTGGVCDPMMAGVVCDPGQQLQHSGYTPDVRLARMSYGADVAASDSDTETEETLPYEHEPRGGRARDGKPDGNPYPPSRANSVLTLTDTEHENNKSDTETVSSPDLQVMRGARFDRPGRHLKQWTDPLTPSTHHNQATLRQPQLPPVSHHLHHHHQGLGDAPHPHGLTQHHPSLTSLSHRNSTAHRNSSGHGHSQTLGHPGGFVRERRNPSPVGAQHQGGGQPTLQIQEGGWERVGSVPLESRNLGKGPSLENGQDSLMEMAVFAPACRDTSYGEGCVGSQGVGVPPERGPPRAWSHFLFKPGSGTTPLFSSPAPGYPLTSSAAYSPPTRPLPRGTFPRGTFTFKQPYRVCSWRCAALSAIAAAALLTILLVYFIVLHVYGLNWQFQAMPVQPGVRDAGRPGHVGDAMGTAGKGNASWDSRSIDSGEVEVGRRAVQDVPAGVFWRSQIYLDQAQYLKFNISLDRDAVLGVYGRKGLPPTHTQYDFIELLAGSRLVGRDRRSPGQAVRRRRNVGGVLLLQRAGFIQFMDPGIWHVAFYNDGLEPERVTFVTSIAAAVDECPSNCNGNGECVAGICHCFPGFLGPDCSRASCLVLCSGNGLYLRGRCLCHSGWKGSECDVPSEQCLDPACSGHGSCVMGSCVCHPGYKGESCEEVDCMEPQCSGNGVCVQGVCICTPGWGGSNCESPRLKCPDQCSGHGSYLVESNSCSCDPNWTGSDCSVEMCALDCGSHGVCVMGSCRCEEGWSGVACDQRACHPNCAEHGICRDGTCECSQGWNGEHCTIAHYQDKIVEEGCPGLCNGNGRCALEASAWHCLCEFGWRGAGCDVSMETACEDGKDNDGDGLSDCVDPDCCLQHVCRADGLCQGSPDPEELLPHTLQPPSQRANPQAFPTFFQSTHFLVGRDRAHVVPGDNPFNRRTACVVRGQVQTLDGTPLVGVNVSFPHYPSYGYTVTRQDGAFDLMASGGRSVTLQFERAPFTAQLRTVWLPWNRFIVVDTVVMRREENDIPSCDVSGFVRPNPSVLPSPLTSVPGSCGPLNPIIPEIQAVQESITLPGSELHLRYVSSRAPGYHSRLSVRLTPASVPFNLLKVHLSVAVEGRFFRTWFPSAPNLRHTFIWDKTNAYGQPVYGIAEALVSVGYEYESCPELILWENRVAILQGLELDASSLGIWGLSNHHALHVPSGTMHKGTGENVFVWRLPPVITSVMGNGRRRSITCPSCNGVAEGNKLLAPMSLACAADGSLYVGDFNFVRRIFPSGNVTSVFELRNKDLRHSNNPSHRYYLAVDPVSGWLYVSDTNSRRLYRVRSLTGRVGDLTSNGEVVAGTGEQCLPLDETRCGDGGRAVNASLTNPRGVAVDKHGIIYFVDGTMIRRIDENGIISTLIGSNNLASVRPLSCDFTLDINQVQLGWPTALAVSPLDNSLYILDNNIVLQVLQSQQVRVVAGRPMHCPLPPAEHQGGGRLATHAVLLAPTAIAVSHSGTLYVAETDERKIHLVWRVTSDGEISPLAGAASECDCKSDVSCDCFAGDDGYAKDARLNAPSSLAVCPDGVVFVADLANIRIRAVRPNRPTLNVAGQYEIASTEDQELYVFNRDGNHLHTLSLVSGEFLYNFSYSGDRDLVTVSGGSGALLKVRRDSTGMPLRLVVDDSLILSLTLNANSGLKSVSSQGAELAFLTYHSGGGLLATKSDENGWTTFYQYDVDGRLTNVTFPSGLVKSLNGDARDALRVVQTSSQDEDVTITTNLSTVKTYYSLLQDQSKNAYAVGHDGSLQVAYASGLQLGLHTEPHVVAGPASPAAVRLNISLPMEGGVSMLEWRLRKEQARGNVTVYGRKLRVNGRNILSMDFNRQTRTEKINDDHRKFTLRVVYNQLGRPTLWQPDNKLTALNVTYSARGRMLTFQRGSMSERIDYDTAGRLKSRTFADGRTWSYSYLDRSMVLLLHSQRQFIFEFDSSDRLASVTMPSVARHTLATLRSVGYYRNVYTPPESNASVIQDVGEDGLVLRIAYTGTGRRVHYKYKQAGKLTEVLYDGTRVGVTYDDLTGMLKLVNLQDGGYACTLRYRHAGPLVDKQILRFNEEGMVNARFDYSYDNGFRVTSVQTVINETPLPIDLYHYDDISGKVEQFGKFAVIYYDINQIITTAVMTLTKHFDGYGRVKEVQYEIYRSLMYWMVLQYDNLGRVSKRELKVGPYANTTKYTYEYDADGQLQSVSINEKVTWRYSYDLNGNLYLLNPGNSARLTPLRYDLRDRINRLGDIRYVADEDGFLKQRGSDSFEYNSNGQLIRAYNKAVGWSITYRYDGHGRRVSRRSGTGEHLQFFYADLDYPSRLTHIYNHSSSEILSLYYDLQGHLFAAEFSGGEEFYVATDDLGTPLAIFSSSGLVVRHMQYTAYGEIYVDTKPDFQLCVGFHGGLYDSLTRLVHFGRRDYDILSGRWTSPDVDVWKDIGSNPRPFNLYTFKNNNPVGDMQDGMKYVTDVNSWLQTFGFQLHNVIPGFAKPKVNSYEPHYELTASQRQDTARAVSWVDCGVHKKLKAFTSLESLPMRDSPDRSASRHRDGRVWFTTVVPILGKGVMFANSHGRITTDIINIASEDSRRVAAMLNNSHYLEGLHFTVEGKETHHFVKVGSPEGDLATLGLTGGRKTLESGVNASVWQSTALVAGRTRRYTDVSLQAGGVALNVRYGGTAEEERARALEVARQRAISLAWAREQERVRDGDEGSASRAWSEGERRQLLAEGRVAGYEGFYLLSAEQYPELADSPANIQFLKQSEIGRR
uniref:Teneurin-3-like isoform X4 n=1 Tax=Petromyzon marinus TaxID=7757 RepID=A0AAJ7TZU8_PETMA|nr:teneurin-3-like isoform X4 [Petromyzon marinus]